MDPSKSVSQYKKDNAKLQTKIDQYSKKVGQLTIEKEFLEGKYSGEFFRTVFSQKIDVKLSKILSILTLPKYTSAGVL
ncbi:hypothetical protein fh0823_05170 [Francisella halioticida]|uniref:hypothetical protein n=1 Tax=Francisella halioticida TaxID=549298 RepID=UPI001AFAB3D9|nr:hypothetical protein [Francisella halioticida]BCD90378.1 hypothetical protein fh0823_05170 [Francisella halioticida]